MPDWAIAILIAVLTAAATLLLRESVEWLRRPNLKIDFEERDGHKPYILDLFLERQGLDKSNKAKFLRLNVRNTGRKPAMDCEAKMVIVTEGTRETFAPSMHWARRDPPLYKTPDQIYAPIHLNRKDEEPLDIFKLPYCPEEHGLGPGVCIGSMSYREFPFKRNITYLLKVTVYASNTISKPFTFRLCWDGTLEGFDKAVSKGGKEEK